MRTGLKYTVILAVTVTAIVIVRLFIAGSYRIASNKTGTTLKVGDCVLVNKTKFGGNPGRNRLILYYSPLRRDADNPPVFAGRCVGMPNDIVQMGADGFRINGSLLPNMPLMQPTYRIRKNIKYDILTAMEILNIPMRDVREDSLNLIMRLSLREKELLVNNISKALHLEMIENRETDYEFVIPRKSKALMINPVTLTVCREAILSEAGETAVIDSNKLFINGIETKTFFFDKDYYWVLSENESEGIDSRHLGLIPAENIIGNIWYCWYSKDPTHRFKLIK
jgi:signal peptidase I